MNLRHCSGQCFSSTRPVMEINHEKDVIDIDDIESLIDSDHPDKGTFNHTDGCGFCSPDVMLKVQQHLKLLSPPSAIQVTHHGSSNCWDNMGQERLKLL